MKTILYEKHQQLNAKIVDFAGWEMPLHYSGTVQEHLAVRKAAGIFDVSHMGRIAITGKDAAHFLDYLCTNKVSDKKLLSVTYAVLCNSDGGSIDDILVYRQEEDRFFIIVNASNRETVMKHLRKYSTHFDVQIAERFYEEGILAIQGPLAEAILSLIFPEVHSLKPMHFTQVRYLAHDAILSNTGYTGSKGYEIYAPTMMIPDLWDKILFVGKSYGLVPAGLGARDTLRLEMGYALYGHELNQEIAPIESVSAWTVRMDKEDFVGKEALEKLDHDPKKRAEYGVVLIDKGIARESCKVFFMGKEIGIVTSGNFAPSLNKSVAIVLVEGTLSEEDEIEIQIRDNLVKAKVTKLPFYCS